MHSNKTNHVLKVMAQTLENECGWKLKTLSYTQQLNSYFGWH
jgi:hypothetical protein